MRKFPFYFFWLFFFAKVRIRSYNFSVFEREKRGSGEKFPLLLSSSEYNFPRHFRGFVLCIADEMRAEPGVIA